MLIAVEELKLEVGLSLFIRLRGFRIKAVSQVICR